MATFAQIKSLRLRIHDPLGFIDLQEVEELPTDAAPQTAYQLASSGIYQEKRAAGWKNIKLEISDEQLGLLVDLYGLGKAAIQAVKNIMMALGKELRISSSGSGTETIQYQNLTVTYNFYKSMLDSMQEDLANASGTDTGLFVGTRQAVIGGVPECRNNVW